MSETKQNFNASQQQRLNAALALADELNRDTATLEEAFMDERFEQLVTKLRQLVLDTDAGVFEDLMRSAEELNHDWGEAVEELIRKGAVRK